VRHDTDSPRHVANQTFENEDEDEYEYEDDDEDENEDEDTSTIVGCPTASKRALRVFFGRFGASPGQFL
jgi:hypothetical protein